MNKYNKCRLKELVWCNKLTFLSANFSGNIWITPPAELMGDVSELLEDVRSDFVLREKIQN